MNILSCAGDCLSSRTFFGASAALAAVLICASAEAQQSMQEDVHGNVVAQANQEAPRATSAREDDRVAKRQGLEEVVVTARKREESLQNVPLPVSALTQDDLRSIGAEGFHDWANYIAGVTMFQGQEANRRAGPTATIRGVSHEFGGQLTEMSAQSTTTYNFGQLPISAGNPRMFDLNRVEVLRGPQGTLFGLASMGGTIRFIPNEARTDKFAASVSGGAASVYSGGNVYDFDFMANVPIVENVFAIRLSGGRYKNDGYIDVFLLPLDAGDLRDIHVDGRGNLFDSRGRSRELTATNANGNERMGGRLSFTYTPNDRSEIRAFWMTQKGEQQHKQLIDYNDLSQEWVASRFMLEPQQDDFEMTSLEATQDLGFGRIEYVGGYFEQYLSETTDGTAFVTGFLNGTGMNAGLHVLDRDGPGGLPKDPWPSVTPFPFSTKNRIVSNELRLQDEAVGLSWLGRDATFDYVLGVFRMTENRYGQWNFANPSWNANRGPNTFPILTEGGLVVGFAGRGTFESNAIFGDVMLNLTRRLSIGAGVRYSDSERSALQYGWGDAFSGRAANGATVGDNLDVLRLNLDQSAGANSVTPRGTIKYMFGDQNQRMLYFDVAKGHRMPLTVANPNFFQTSGICRPAAEALGVVDDILEGPTSDELWTYDLGWKSTWFDRRLTLNGAVYHTDWSDIQRNVRLVTIDPACNAIIPANVGEVEIDGFELEWVYALFSRFTLAGGVGFADARVARTQPGVFDSLGQQLEKGDSIQNAAPWTGYLRATYNFKAPYLDTAFQRNFSGFAGINWVYTDERMGTNTGDKASLKAHPVRSMFISPAYQMTNATLGLTDSEWHAAFYVSNVFNERAVHSSFQLWPNIRTTAVSAPRTIGIRIQKKFN